MFPHCSEYAREAYGRHNPVRATLMTCDRLMRCGGDADEYDEALITDGYRRLDCDTPTFREPGQRVLGSADTPTPPKGWGCCAQAMPESLGREMCLPLEPRADVPSFADWLKRCGFYDRAITEYLRLLHDCPGPSHAQDAQASICHCLYLLGRYPEAVRWGKDVLAAGGAAGARNDLLYLLGVSSYRLGVQERAAEFFASVDPTKAGSEDLEPAVRAPLLLGLAQAHARDWTGAESVFLGIPAEHRFASQADYCAELCRRGRTLKQRNPSLAGGLAVVPGLGYLYDGYGRTALAALIINGLFLWGTTEAFLEGHEGLGGVLAFFGAGWYAGSIYGSVVSAHRANQKQEEELLRKFELGFEF